MGEPGFSWSPGAFGFLRAREDGGFMDKGNGKKEKDMIIDDSIIYEACAILAMQSFIRCAGGDVFNPATMEFIAESAYKMAGAMMKRREKWIAPELEQPGDYS
jgi:hypothetical protein